jgi:hypothetical protein
MAVAAIYDALFGLAILLAPGTASRLLGIPLPADSTYLGLVGVLLLVLAGLYTLPARDPVRFAPVAAVSAAGRVLGAAYLARIWAGGQAPAFLALAAGDLAFAVAQTTLLLWSRREERR